MSEVELQVADGVAVITLAATKRRNALTVEMANELVAACDQVDGDRSVGVAVVTGGPFFCAGAHRDVLVNAGKDPAAAAAYEGLSAIYRSFARVSELTVPTVAAVRGGAVGAGVNLLLSTTVRVISADATIASGFVKLGIHPGGGHLALLNRLAGYQTAAAMAIFDEPLNGADAARLGLAWIAVADDAVEQRAMDLARRAAADPALSRMILSSFRLEVGPPALPLAAALELERAAQMRTLRRLHEK